MGQLTQLPPPLAADSKFLSGIECKGVRGHDLFAYQHLRRKNTRGKDEDDRFLLAKIISKLATAEPPWLRHWSYDICHIISRQERCFWNLGISVIRWKLPSAFLGMKSTVLVLQRRYSPVPSTHTYITWIPSLGWSRVR